MAKDRMILGNGENCIFTTDSEVTGLNNNVLVVGASGSGKTMSVSEACLLETYHSSLLISITKKRLAAKYSPVLLERGIEVFNLDFVHPSNGDIGYDPLDYLDEYSDITFLARSIVLAEGDSISDDPYWSQAAISLLSAEIAYVLMTKDNPTFADVLDMNDKLAFVSSDGVIRTSHDEMFERLAEVDPTCFAVSCWRTFKKLPIKTASCVFSTLNATIASIFSPELRKMFRLQNKVDFKRIASRKTVLFVTTSAVNPSLNSFVNMFYGHAFKQLFEYAEEQPNGKLPIPVRVLADDGATGCPIPMLDSYISIFREKDISITLLLQSESQLVSLYSESRAQTIINNCDTYVFLGSMDLHTGKNISLKANVPLDEVLYMPVGSEILFRRGQKPIFTTRYNIKNDPLYQKITRKYEAKISEQMSPAMDELGGWVL